MFVLSIGSDSRASSTSTEPMRARVHTTLLALLCLTASCESPTPRAKYVPQDVGHVLGVDVPTIQSAALPGRRFRAGAPARGFVDRLARRAHGTAGLRVYGAQALVRSLSRDRGDRRLAEGADGNESRGVECAARRRGVRGAPGGFG